MPVVFVKDALDTHSVRARPAKVLDVLLGMSSTNDQTDVVQLVVK